MSLAFTGGMVGWGSNATQDVAGGATRGCFGGGYVSNICLLAI